MGALADHLVDAENILVLCMKEKMWSWSGDSFTIKKEDGSPFLNVKGKAISLHNKMTLLDLEDRPIAVIIRKLFSLHSTFYIYSVKPYVEGQPASEETTEDGTPLYSWATVSKILWTIPQSYSVCFATGNDTYDGGSYMGSPPRVFSPEMSVSDVSSGAGAALVNRAFFQFECANSYSLTIAPGIDPALMIAFVAIKDEIAEADRGAGAGSS